MEVFIHEEYVNKRREQRRRRKVTKTLQIETTEKRKKLPQPQPSASSGQGSPREQPAGVWWWSSSPTGSPTAAEAASFRDHLFDYLKPY